jgi:hypothetical protein
LSKAWLVTNAATLGVAGRRIYTKGQPPQMLRIEIVMAPQRGVIVQGHA